MAKIGNETKLIVRLLKEKANHSKPFRENGNTTYSAYKFEDKKEAEAYRLGFEHGKALTLLSLDNILIELEN